MYSIGAGSLLCQEISQSPGDSRAMTKTGWPMSRAGCGGHWLSMGKFPLLISELVLTGDSYPQRYTQEVGVTFWLYRQKQIWSATYRRKHWLAFLHCISPACSGADKTTHLRCRWPNASLSQCMYLSDSACRTSRHGTVRGPFLLQSCRGGSFLWLSLHPRLAISSSRTSIYRLFDSRRWPPVFSRESDVRRGRLRLPHDVLICKAQMIDTLRMSTVICTDGNERRLLSR